jgi:flagellar L-ring protein precursor FlgH
MNALILSLVLLQSPGNASLFSADSPNLFLYRDQKARAVGDIVTIQVVETATATNSATTATQKKGDISLNAPALGGIEKGASALNFANILQGAGGINFNGTGSTSRTGQLQRRSRRALLKCPPTEIFVSKETRKSQSMVNGRS